MGIGSKRLERKVERAYENKGYSVSKSRHIAGAVAGKVFREQQAHHVRRGLHRAFR